MLIMSQKHKSNNILIRNLLKTRKPRKSMSSLTRIMRPYMILHIMVQTLFKTQNALELSEIPYLIAMRVNLATEK